MSELDGGEGAGGGEWGVAGRVVLLVAIAVALGVSGAIAVVGCGSNGSTTSSGAGGNPGSGTPGGAGAAAGQSACSDLFSQDVVRSYAIDISSDEWSRITAEFNNVAVLAQSGNDFVADHPVVVHLEGETVSDATFRLHGQSSWLNAVKLDGDRAKMQFDISFHATDPNGKFHGVGKLVFDMPRDDWTFLHDRLAHAWFRQVGIAAGCAASATVEINGSPYGLFVVEENTAKRVIGEFFPNNPTGGLWKGGVQPETNQAMPAWDREMAFWHATDIASATAIVDVDGSVMEWAGEALINDADGYYNGNHNFYIYDQGSKGFVFLPNDTDSSFDWLSLFDHTGSDNHPVYWWEGRIQPVAVPGNIWLAVMNDPASRAKYVDALATQLGHWDVKQVQGWIDSWSQQIAADVAADPHTPVTMDNFQTATAAARDVVAQRAQFLQSFVDCEKNATGADQDGDGFRWCEDCRDADPAVHPGAAEICGNGVDDNCNGVIDEGC